MCTSPAEGWASLSSSRWTGGQTRWRGFRSSCWPAAGHGTWRSTPVKLSWLLETRKATVSSWSELSQKKDLLKSLCPCHIITSQSYFNPKDGALQVTLDERTGRLSAGQRTYDHHPHYHHHHNDDDHHDHHHQKSGATTTPGDGPVQPSFLEFLSNEW